MKRCRKCGKAKDEKDFYSFFTCKECIKDGVRINYKNKKEKYQQYDKNRQRYSFKRMFQHRYAGMKMRVNGGGIHGYSVVGKEICTRQDFMEWCFSPEVMQDFLKLYEDWSKNEFIRKLSPSIDRIDNKYGYTLDNIRWISQRNNSRKYNK